ncbi:MAG: glycosyl hydrolase, partial [Fimbriimonas sp.]
GSVPTGKDNHPAPPEGDGLEVDKLSRAALDKHWDGMMAKVIAQVGPLAGKSLNNSLIDSYEVGSQNWTPKFREDFRRLRGYDPLPFMPALAGVTIESGPTTERFLWDYRRTIADLYAENYFGYFGELCHKKGLLFSTEPYGNGGFDNIQAGGTSDIPMGEFWLGGAAMESTKLASSIAHVYGRQIVGAESFTADDVRGKFLEEPYMMKTVGDLAWINGVNRYIFHRYALQPWTNLRPGMTMGPWGTHLERTQTWWKEAATWLKYVARSQYLLQSGKFVADAVAYTGETAPVDLPYGRGAGRLVPEGYDYDGCDTRILMAMKVSNGSVVVPSGLKYRVLLLPPTTFMTPKVARKIRSLVADGATVVGPKPLHSPSLTGFPASETEIAKIGSEVWGAGPVNSFGKGKVYSKASAGEVLRDLKVAPDFSYTGKAKLLHLHRTIGDAEVYFVSNQRYQAATAECTFRVAGKQPELWHPETGKTEFAPIWAAGSGNTRVTLRLQPAESVFVVFRGKQTQSHLTSFSSGEAAQIKGQLAKVVSARYETADGRGVDVTAKVRDLLSHGETEIEVTNSNFGDPVVNVVKRLNIEYSVDGVTRRATVGENETLSIGPSGPVGSVNDAEIKVTPGGLSFVAWEKGKWSLASAEVTSRGPTVMDLSTDWKLTFAPSLGAPAVATFPKLASWTAHQNPGIRYFSGSAVYTKSFSVAKVGQRVRLDLGDVKNFATVKLNGKNLGTLWKPPFLMDVTGAVQKGTNWLEVKVTNLWVNRLIGDEQLPPDVEWNGVQLKSWPEWLTKNQPRPKTGRIGFVTWRFWTKESPLLDSGLLGPVRLLTASEVTLRGHN